MSSNSQKRKSSNNKNKSSNSVNTSPQSGNEHSRRTSISSNNKKSPVLIPPPLVQVDFGHSGKSVTNDQRAKNGETKVSKQQQQQQQQHSPKANTAKLPNGEPVSFKNKPRSSSNNSNNGNKNYSQQSLPDGKKPNFGNGKDIKLNGNSNRATLKKKSKEETSNDLLNLLRNNSPSSDSFKTNSKSPSPSVSIPSKSHIKVDGAYAGNSFTYSTPSLISLPKPTFS